MTVTSHYVSANEVRTRTALVWRVYDGRTLIATLASESQARRFARAISGVVIGGTR